MTQKQGQNDRIFDGLVRRAIVPRGFRPQSNAEIESMLEGLGHGEMPEEKLQRMLAKIHRQIRLSWENGDGDSPDWECDSAEAHELAEMFRARGEELPPELEQKLREMEKRAAEPGDQEKEAHGN
jgi:hypothetical protein